jgi:UDP-N-acetyl-D-galactosamine dehydrogenase
MLTLAAIRPAVIGLGHVGLPLAVALAARRPVLGFDIDPGRIAELAAGRDRTREVPPAALAAARRRLAFSADPAALAACNTFVVTVPTPVDAHKRPDLRPLLAASGTVGRALRPGGLVIYESTVYPGATEELCVPALEAASGLACNRDFWVGYSPERMNPGDPARRLADIVKVTAASTPAAAALVDAFYAEVVPAGTHPAASIRIAEAAKVIENVQRDLNIALVNELAILFNRLGLDTEAVLRAAGTKWNFLPFRPGLVGGHCIGVDPYYLTHKATEVGLHPELILAGRRVNDAMGAYVAGRMLRAMLRAGIAVSGARVLVMGLAFKENCPDPRNSRVVDVVAALAEVGAAVEVWDPEVDPDRALAEHRLRPVAAPAAGAYDGILLAVPHRRFVAMGAAAIRALGRPGHVFFDMKSVFAEGESDLRL